MKKIVRILAGLVMGLMCVNCASARSGNEDKGVGSGKGTT